MSKKICQLEEVQSRFQSEAEILNVDLEKAQNIIAFLERAKEQLERQVEDLKYVKAVEQKKALARKDDICTVWLLKTQTKTT
ncbi:hypothetical protein GCK72_022835 [Caenorhabditis remanei]|nr:hypothetical protein GCK72_022835 [Caenorhabditis remanei]KAF1746381.1 hypothetical protein GCK72_022835 [Caenorhabditis remanei]